MEFITLNMNVNLRQGGRNAVRMPMEEFKEKVERLCDEYGYGSLQDTCYNAPSIQKDMKVNIGLENFEYSYRMTSSGVPYIFIEATSDYSTWMVFMVYWDGKKFRAYIPTYGNPYNTKTKEPLGENPEEDLDFIFKQAGKIVEVNEEFPEETLWNLLQDAVGYDEEACIKDFEARLTIK